ncbi:cache domain-containing protein, partial [Pararhodospirillum oryzae]|uniref:cache domain-containing protein n=1 Tax=Pararhodospirillum oryzae TaxID=478448 RepID=UPI0011BDC134
MARSLPLAVRISLPVLIMAAGLFVTVAAGLWMQSVNMVRERKILLEEHVTAATSLATLYQTRVTNGTLSTEAAQAEMQAVMRAQSFGEGNYVFVLDQSGRMLVNRGAPQVEGKDFSLSPDAHGFLFVQEMMNVARTQGGGFVRYMWPHAGQDKPVPKLTYVHAFAPWGWVIGTGVYMDDLDAMMWRQGLTLAGVALLILLVAGAVAFVATRGVTRPLDGMKRAMVLLSRGDLDVSLNGEERGDELGEMARALAVFRDNARANRRLEEEARATAERQVVERREARQALADSFEAEIGEILTGLSVAAEQLDRTAQAMTETARVSLEQARDVRDALAQTTGNVQSVASAAEEMSASVGEISGQVHRSTDVVG